MALVGRRTSERSYCRKKHHLIVGKNFPRVLYRANHLRTGATGLRGLTCYRPPCVRERSFADRDARGGDLMSMRALPVLFVDDEPANIELFRMQFEAVFAVQTAAGGRQ